ncbi:YafY family transcriptional regulator [Paenibacillus sp. CAA11]|uniref:helix-turn-helix transcriptional regulator n=1 Tax=Paenibacillus sp. CAA11 TaxID=1532905 RepID=UPI000D3569B2|nr:YafY family protein [Paenibacillus sp. CAA11]AWB43122.1 YafY family transcriptional regulator [Paenibacillus sp. CAA11]
MNKTERLLTIVLELQRSKLLKAEELAERLETSVRTIYRDVQALSEAGVPIVGLPGLGYSLMEGYFLPPISFTMEEAVALLMGSDFIKQHFDPQISSSALSSRRKIEAILPQRIRTETDRMYSNIRLLSPGEEPKRSVQEKTYIQTIRAAMHEGKKIRFRYRKSHLGADGSRETVRTVAPFGLVFVQGAWALLARCDLREDIRHFRVSRMSDLTVTEEPFELPDDFDLHKYRQTDDRRLHIRVCFRSEVADKVQEANHFFMEDAELLPDGYYVNFRVRRPEELLHWILGWGADAVVIEPDSLRNLVREEIDKMRERY